VRFAVRVTPKGGRDAIDGWGADAEGRRFLKVRVSAAPADGAANAAVVALLAKALGRPKSGVRIVAGDTARLKLVEVEDLDEAALAAVAGKSPP
jgi:uncharacterized protein